MMTPTQILTRLSIEMLSAISLRDGDKPVLRRVSLTVDTGEVHGLVGESGAGKSTIAKAILGIIPSQVKVTGGRIDFEGRDLLALRPGELREILGRDIALIPQDPSTALNPARRIDAQMTDGLRLKRGLSAKEARIRAARVARRGANPRSGSRAEKLSASAFRRHAPARAHRRGVRA